MRIPFVKPVPEGWHSWFAWRPVITQDMREIVWLEHVERKPFDSYGGGGWLYRTINEEVRA